MPFLETTTGVTLHYEEKGEGSPVVLIHGWGMSSAVWRFQDELADSNRLISLDLRGHGRSSAPAIGYGLADLTGDMVELFVELELENALLVGWSLGAQLALAAFHQLRERLAGLVLVGATPRFTLAGDWPHGLPPKEPKGMGTGLKRDYQKAMGGFFRSMFAEGELSREQESRIAREIVIPGRQPEPAVALATLDILATTDLRWLLAEVDLPVLVIHGRADSISLPGAAEFLVKQLPSASLRLFEKVGHAPFLSRPAECNAIIRDFMRVIHGRH